MDVTIEEHYVCNICNGCYHDSKESAIGCCNNPIKRLHNGVSEKEFREKHKANTQAD